MTNGSFNGTSVQDFINMIYQKEEFVKLSQTYTNKGSVGERRVRNTLPIAVISIGSPTGVPVP
jgi:hypothetical protein